MADIKVTELAKITPALTDYVLGIGANEEYQCRLSDMAGLFIRNYTELNLGGERQSIEDALYISDTTIQAYENLGMQV